MGREPRPCAALTSSAFVSVVGGKRAEGHRVAADEEDADNEVAGPCQLSANRGPPSAASADRAVRATNRVTTPFP